MKKYGIIILLLGLASFGCKKYPEGDRLKKLYKNLPGNWEIVSYTIAGNDSLNTLPYHEITISDFRREKFASRADNETVKYDIARVTSIIDGSEMGVIPKGDKRELQFFKEPVGSSVLEINKKGFGQLLYPEKNSLAAQYFTYTVLNWLGEQVSEKHNNFEIIKLTKNEMKLRSYAGAKYAIEYEFVKK